MKLTMITNHDGDDDDNETSGSAGCQPGDYSDCNHDHQDHAFDDDHHQSYDDDDYDEIDHHGDNDDDIETSGSAGCQ